MTLRLNFAARLSDVIGGQAGLSLGMSVYFNYDNGIIIEMVVRAQTGSVGHSPSLQAPIVLSDGFGKSESTKMGVFQ